MRLVKVKSLSVPKKTFERRTHTYNIQQLHTNLLFIWLIRTSIFVPNGYELVCILCYSMLWLCVKGVISQSPRTHISHFGTRSPPNHLAMVFSLKLDQNRRDIICNWFRLPRASQCVWLVGPTSCSNCIHTHLHEVADFVGLASIHIFLAIEKALWNIAEYNTVATMYQGWESIYSCVLIHLQMLPSANLFIEIHQPDTI